MCCVGALTCSNCHELARVVACQHANPTILLTWLFKSQNNPNLSCNYCRKLGVYFVLSRASELPVTPSSSGSIKQCDQESRGTFVSTLPCDGNRFLRSIFTPGVCEVANSGGLSLNYGQTVLRETSRNIILKLVKTKTPTNLRAHPGWRHCHKSSGTSYLLALNLNAPLDARCQHNGSHSLCKKHVFRSFCAFGSCVVSVSCSLSVFCLD